MKRSTFLKGAVALLAAPSLLEKMTLPSAGPVGQAYTYVTVDEAMYFRARDIVRFHPTGEVMRIVSISTNTLTVERV